jgi:hypothetical protein
MNINKIKNFLYILFSFCTAFALHGTEVKQLHSLSQKSGTTCGYYALANAHAIQKLFQRNSPLTEQNIQKEAESILATHFSSFYSPLYDMLSSSEKRSVGSLRQYAEDNTDLLDLRDTFETDRSQTTIFNLFGLAHNKLENAYIVHSLKNKLDCPLHIAASIHHDPEGSALINIGQENRKLVHFIYHMGSYNSGHWVYIGVVKEKNKEPYIVHLNSTNAPISSSRDAQTIIAHLTKCIHYNDPLMKKDSDEIIAQRLQQEEYLAHQLGKKDIQFNTIEQQTHEQEALDAQLARTLQEEEDALYAQRLQDSFDRDERVKQEQRKQSDEQFARRLQTEYDRMR